MRAPLALLGCLRLCSASLVPALLPEVQASQPGLGFPTERTQTRRGGLLPLARPTSEWEGRVPRCLYKEQNASQRLSDTTAFSVERQYELF